MTSIATKIIKRVRGHGRGKAVFTWNDFRDLGPRAAIDQALSRLSRSGKLRRVARGMYDLPRASKLLKGPAPATTDAILDAVRRRDNVAIKTDHLAAANALGLTTAVPVQARYRTTGGRRNIRLGNSVLQLRPAGQKLDDWLETPASTAMQALHYMGSGSADDPKVIRALQNKLSSHAKSVLKDSKRYRPSWMEPVLAKVTARDETQARQTQS